MAHQNEEVDAAAQAELAAAFMDGAVEGAPAPVECIETHLSYVFLAGERVFKLKRAKRLPFVDFATRERRRAACEAELVVNRRMAASLYLDVLPVARGGDGRFRIGGDGEIVDWVVAMRRFDQAQQFDRLAMAGRLTRDLVEGAADKIAAMHLGAPASRLAGHAADYRRIIEGLRQTEEQGAGRLGVKPGSARLFEGLEAELARVGGLIERRRASGKVRRGHGDLHLRNICVFEGEPTPFDALEFDERMATTDVLYDLAFLLMDLRRAGLAAHANAAFNRYWDAAGEDEEGLELLPFFTALRATVRMAVAVEAAELAEAQGYRALGLELLRRRPPVLVAVGGLSGAGKSALAAVAAPLLPGPAGARLLRSDVVRKRQLGLAPEQRADADAYAPERSREVYRELTERAAAAVSAGASAVADATFRSPAARNAIARAAGHARMFAYWLEAPLELRLARVSGRVRDASDADAAVAAEQRTPEDIGPPWRRLDAGRSVDSMVADIVADLDAAAVETN